MGRKGFQASVILSVLSLLIIIGCNLTQKTPEKVTVRIGFGAWPGYMPWQVATQKNFFAAHGIQVETKWFDNYTDSIN
ncbi:MAG: hypothetical protein NZ821_08240, partial [Gloeomargarita sp. SKYB31]|nr:hypothetical protein [Gloeomargarita sp. SKYB31]